MELLCVLLFAYVGYVGGLVTCLPLFHHMISQPTTTHNNYHENPIIKKSTKSSIEDLFTNRTYFPKAVTLFI